MSNLLKPRGYQIEALDAIDKSLQTYNRVACVLPTGLGKGHPLNTDVPTPSGLRKWGDLKVGDYVFGSNGLPTKVTAIYDRGKLPTYKVCFKHGESVDVDGDHLWQVQRKGRKPEVVSTAELMTRKLKDRDGYCWAVPIAGAVHHPTKDLDIHPYVVGALIANGGMTSTGTMLTTPDPEVALRVAEHEKIQSVADTTPGVCPRYSLPGLMGPTRRLGLRVPSTEKRIPREYLESDIPQRIDLLHGLVDGDGGSRTGGRRSVNYFTTSRGLAFDVKELVTSLGGTCSIRLYNRTSEGKGEEFLLTILMPSSIPAFSTTRRDQEEKPRRTFEPRNPIISIFRSGYEEIRCITVEAEDSLYLITRNHIVTHNTVVFAYLIDRAHDQGRKAMVLVHREELAEQAKAKVHSVAPHLTVGIVKAERNEVDADVIIASVQTLAHEARRRSVLDAGAIGIVIVDECHHSIARTWMEVLADFGCFGPAEDDDPIAWCDCRHDEGVCRPGRCRNQTTVPCVGFTATLTRTDGKGLGDVWETVAYEKDILYGIDNGYLTDVRGQQVTVDGLDLATVARSRGDYQEGQLGEAMEASGAGEIIAAAYREHASTTMSLHGIRQGVLFAPTVATAYSFAEDMRKEGIRAETIEGHTPSEDRKLIYKRYEQGEIDVLTNAMVLTEGWDAPWAEVAVIARPTQSASLYTQMVGRVLRPWPGKDEALVLDVVGITAAHKLQSLTQLLKTTVLDGESYAEARLRLEKEIRERVDGPRVKGQLAAKQVELFANSHSTWLQTHAGIWFVPVKAGVFFLWPETGALDGLYKLGFKKQYDRKRVNGSQWGVAPEAVFERQNGWITEAMTLEYAMSWGEQLAQDEDPTVSLKDRSWRRTKPSEAQINYALRLKVADPDVILEMRKGELSDRISIAVASKMLDGYR